jgi:hypothetical protein
MIMHGVLGRIRSRRGHGREVSLMPAAQA